MAGTITHISPASGSEIVAGQDLTVMLQSDAKLNYAYLSGSCSKLLVSGGVAQSDSAFSSNNQKIFVFTIPGDTIEEGTNEYHLSFSTASSGANSSIEWSYIATSKTACKGPSWCRLDTDKSTGNAVTLRWGEGTPGTNNPIATYAVYRAELTDPDDYPDDDVWELVGDTTGTSMSVSPPETIGNYYLYSVWAYGKNLHDGNDEEWCDSENLLQRIHVELEGFTDSPLVAGVTPVKALHMTELQDRVNTLRTSYGLSKYSFTTITSGAGKIADWSAHVAEIRAAVDEVAAKAGKSHAAWLEIPANRPRADVIEQLRAVVLAI